MRLNAPLPSASAFRPEGLHLHYVRPVPRCGMPLAAVCRTAHPLKGGRGGGGGEVTQVRSK
jgi:hypothetical protein